MGEVSDFSIFLSAVIDEKSFDRISGYIDAAKADPNCTIIAGGNVDKSKGKNYKKKCSRKYQISTRKLQNKRYPISTLRCSN